MNMLAQPLALHQRPSTRSRRDLIGLDFAYPFLNQPVDRRLRKPVFDGIVVQFSGKAVQMALTCLQALLQGRQ